MNAPINLVEIGTIKRYFNKNKNFYLIFIKSFFWVIIVIVKLTIRQSELLY